MSKPLTPKVLVIGGGPGGYVAAIRAAQLGMDTVLVETDRLGGTCLIRGCIPSKSLIHAANLYNEMTTAAQKPGLFGIHSDMVPRLEFSETIAWKDNIVDQLNGGVAALLKRAKVKVITGWASFIDAKTCSVETENGPLTITAEHVILATGSQPVELPFLPFGGTIISSTEALSLTEIPKKLFVIGAGYIGLELGITYAKLGSEVCVIEAQNQILPLYDKALTAPVNRWMKANNMTLHLGAKAIGMDGNKLAIETKGGKPLLLEADKILVAVGRKAVTQGWGLENMSLVMENGFVKIDDQCATSTHNVWAIGDLVGEPMLAHKASAQGEIVAEIISGQRRRFDPVAIPAVCFTEPEIVCIGLGPDDMSDDETIVGKFPLQANGRAVSMNAGGNTEGVDGFVRVIARKSDHRILGIQAVGSHISEFAGQFSTLLEMGAVLEDVTGIIHAHPTLGEAIHESALQALGHAIHI